jgi:hypothetical protein
MYSPREFMEESRIMKTWKTRLRSSIRRLGLALSWLYFKNLRHARWSLAVHVMLAVGLGAGLARLKTVLSLTDLVNPEFPTIVDTVAVEDSFDLGNSATFVFRSLDPAGFRVRELCDLKTWITYVRNANPEIGRVLSPFDIASADHRPDWAGMRAIVPLDCDAPGARTSDDRLLLTQLNDSPWHDLLIERGGRDFGVELEFRDTPGGSRYGKFDPHPVGAVLDGWRRMLRERGYQIEVIASGQAAFQWHFLNAVEADQRLNLVALLLLLVGCRVFFGRWRCGILAVTAQLFTAAFTFGAMGWADAPIDLVSNALFLLIVVAAMQDFLFVSQRSQGAIGHWSVAFSSLLFPAFITSLTTALGFGSLLVGDLEPLRRFGGWAAVGAAAEWWVTFFVLPPLIKTVPWLQSWTHARSSFRLTRGVAWCLERARPRRIWPLVAVGFGGLGFAGWLNVSDSALLTFPRDSEFRDAVAYFQQTRGWEADVGVVFRDASLAGNPDALARIASDPNVAVVEDPWSLRHFAVRDAAAEHVWQLEINLRHAPIWRRYFSEDGQALARLYVKDGSEAAVAALHRRIVQECNGKCAAVGPVVAYAEFSGKLVPTLLESFTVSLALVSAILWAWCLFCGEPRFLRVLVASFWGMGPMVAATALVGARVNFVSCIFIAVVVGIAGDNAAQFLYGGRRRGLAAGLSDQAEASAQIVFQMIALAAMFAASRFEPPRIFGPLFCFGLLCLLVGDVWILRGLLGGSPWKTRSSAA